MFYATGAEQSFYFNPLIFLERPSTDNYPMTIKDREESVTIIIEIIPLGEWEREESTKRKRQGKTDFWPGPCTVITA